MVGAIGTGPDNNLPQSPQINPRCFWLSVPVYCCTVPDRSANPRGITGLKIWFNLCRNDIVSTWSCLFSVVVLRFRYPWRRFVRNLFVGKAMPPFITNQKIRTAILAIQQYSKDDVKNYTRRLHEYAQTLIDKAGQAPVDEEVARFKAELEEYQIALFDWGLLSDKLRVPPFPYFRRRYGSFVLSS